jgi:glutathione synthase/RimK-type ligase-like ATP-grasp enzyme
LKIRLDPYKPRSRSARIMAKHLGVLRTTPHQIRKHGTFDMIINWGNTQRRFPNAIYINSPEAVAHACDKEASLRIFTQVGVPCPDFTTDKARATEWRGAGLVVVARTLLRANSGRGIILCGGEHGGPLPYAPLYTKYVKKAEEYRVHVVAGQVIDVAQKRKRRVVDNDEVNYQVRNACNGWVFCRDGVEPPDPVLDAGRAAVTALGLEFGAVDIGWNVRNEAACVYEVNTAPGVEGSTLDRYKAAFLELVPALRNRRYAERRKLV